MKILLLGLLVSSSFWFLNPPDAPVSWQTPTVYEFGDLSQGNPAKTVFTFQNDSRDSLYIDNIRTACGCTSPQWEDVLVPPDSIGYITIEYDAEDLGYFNKWIKVYFNGYRKAEKLWIEGWVE